MESISLQYPIIEILSGIIVVAVAEYYGISWQSLQTIVFILLMMVVAVIDWQHFIIPNEVIVFGIAIALATQLLIQTGNIYTMIGFGAASGAVTLCIYFAGNYIFKKQTMGIGDIKLSALIGIFIGFELFCWSLWIAVILGALYGLVRIIVFDAPRDSKLPFGSMLAFSAVISFVFRDSLYYIFDLWLNWTLLK